jgi:hypothetical protein
VSSSAAAGSNTTLRQIVFALLVGACAALAGGVWYWRQHVDEDFDGATTPASLPAPTPEVAPPPAREPLRGGTPARDNVIPPPVLEIDSLPETRDGTDAGATTGRGVARGSRPGNRVRVPARAAVTARAREVVPAAATDPVGSNPECSPPWYIDAKGIQRLKPKCL